MTEQEVVIAQRIIDEKKHVEAMLKTLEEADRASWAGGHTITGPVIARAESSKLTLSINADLRPHIIEAVSDYRDELKTALENLGVK